jgi:hypothetical protein
LSWSNRHRVGYVDVFVTTSAQPDQCPAEVTPVSDDGLTPQHDAPEARAEASATGEADAPPPARVGRIPGPVRKVAGWLLTAVAATFALFALLAPDQLGEFTALAFLRLPIEGLIAAAVVLVLPPKPRRIVAQSSVSCSAC